MRQWQWKHNLPKLMNSVKALIESVTRSWRRNEIRALLKHKQETFIMLLHCVTGNHIFNGPFMLSLQLLHKEGTIPILQMRQQVQRVWVAYPGSLLTCLVVNQRQDSNSALCLVHSLYALPSLSTWMASVQVFTRPYLHASVLPYSLTCILWGKRRKLVGCLV